jgi:hypothetical protein
VRPPRVEAASLLEPSSRTAVLLVPLLAVVSPPANVSALPVTIVSPVRSTGSFGSGSRVSTFAAWAGVGGGGASWGATRGTSGLSSGFAVGGGGGGGTTSA